jgi:hypothetical protein
MVLGCTEAAETEETSDGESTASPGGTGNGTATVQTGFGAVLVGEGTVSTSVGEAFPYPDPAGNALYFSVVVDENWQHQRLVVAREMGDGWGQPEGLAFSADRQYSDRAPRLSPDGLRMVFTSNRPIPGRDPDPDDFNLWLVDRAGPGAAWSQARPLSERVNSTSREIHASMTSDGSLYFASARPGGQGRSDIYHARWLDGDYGPAESIGAPINTELSQPDLMVAADGSMMILVITDHPSGLGGDDLYVSRWVNGSWTEPRNLGPSVNTPEYEYGPALSPDGRFLYFTSHRSGEGDTYRIAVSELNLDR